MTLPSATEAQIALGTTTARLLRGRTRLSFLGCSFAIGVFSAFNNFTLTLWLSGFTSSYLILGLMGNSKSFEGALVSPLAGSWSDRLWAGWLGRRRPFILVGGLLSALILAATPWVVRWPLLAGLDGWLQGAPGLALAIAAIFLFTLTFNSMDDLHKALLADLTNPQERNGLSALNVIVEMAGQVGILVLGFLVWKEQVPDEAFAFAGLLVALGVVVTVLGVREPPPSVWAAERGDDPPPSLALVLRVALQRYRGALLLCLVQFAYWSGVNAVLPLVSIYTHDILGATVGEAQLLPGLMLLSTTLLAFPAARLGNRFGKRRVIWVGYALMGSAAMLALFITNVEQGVAVFILAGIGNSAIVVLNIPLLADLVPPQHMGTATGGLAASGSLAAPLASLVAGGLSDLYGPRAIFLLMAAMVLVALALVPLIRTPTERQPGAAVVVT